MAPQSQELQAALRAVSAAADVCRAVASASDLGTLEKSDKSPVTVADFASQAVVARALQHQLGDVRLVAEEGSAELREPKNQTLLERVAQAIDEPPQVALDLIDVGTADATGSFWVLDPIDGTKGFLRGDQYAIALAKIENGTITLGVLGCPNLADSGAVPGPGVILWAERSRGVGQRATGSSADAPIATSSIASADQLRVCESVESGHSRHDTSASLRETLGIEAEAVRIDSQAKYAAVARSSADVYWRLPTRAGYEEKIWDHAAGVVIVEEAGGTVTDIDGAPLDFSQGRTLRKNRGVVATNGPCHARILEAIAPHFPR